MSMTKKIIVGTAVTLALGAGIILSNAFMISATTADPKESAPVVMEERETSNLNVVALSANNGEGSVLAQTPRYTSENPTGPVSEMSKEEQDRLLAEKLKINGYTDEQIPALIEYYSTAAERAQTPAKEYSAEEIERMQEEKLNVLRESGYSEEQIDEIRKMMNAPNTVYLEGIPAEDDIAIEIAIDAARDAVKSKYALTEKTMARFLSTTGFNVVNPDAPTWHISFNPIIGADFSEIGCYNVIMDAKTGEIVEITSAADGRG